MEALRLKSDCIRDYAAEKKLSITHYKCFVHKLRTLQKHLKAVHLSSKLRGSDKDAYSAKLAIVIRATVRLELVLIKKHYKSPTDFINHSKAAIENLLSCFSGKHESYRRHSLVWTAHLESYNTSFLPYDKHIDLNKADINQIKAILHKDFSVEPVEKVCRLSTSNQSVSLHYHVFSYAPKSTIWSQNFTDLCHSAVHSSTFGTGRSSLAIASAIGIKYKATYLMYKQMLKIDANTDCHSQRKRSKQYKLSRHLSRKKKCCKKLQANSLYENVSEETSNEHAYGTNINK